MSSIPTPGAFPSWARLARAACVGLVVAAIVVLIARLAFGQDADPPRIGDRPPPDWLRVTEEVQAQVPDAELGEWISRRLLDEE